MGNRRRYNARKQKRTRERAIMTIRTPLYEHDPRQRRIAKEIERQKPEGVDMTDFIRDLLHRALFGYNLGKEIPDINLTAPVIEIQAQLDEIRAELASLRKQEPVTPSVDFESLMRSIEIMVQRAQPKAAPTYSGPAPEVSTLESENEEYESLEDAENDLMSLFD
jgi:ribosomal protein L12E/L44/L45/RPP1/RPP2